MPENDNVKVAIRVRPLSNKEKAECLGKQCIQVDLSMSSISIDTKSSIKTFTYDFIGDQDITQEELFEVIGQPIASSCLAGYNGTIFAYGQTGSGKTHTILGPSSLNLLSANINDYNLRGLLPRALEFIFNSVKKEIKRCSGVEFLLKCSFLEIYNEQINDLLLPEQRGLQIREDIKKGVYIEGLQIETVLSFEETYELLNTGIKNRHVGATSMNKESSRSHSVFTLAIESKEKKDDLWNFRSSLFHVIDLAGSERQKSTEARGERLKEASMINKSLSTLGNVINSLVDISEGKNRHVHYRDSKLTFLLKDSLGGNSKTCIIANISAASTCFGETLSTLRFAERAKLVKNQAVINEDTVGTIKELREEVKNLKIQLNNAKLLKNVDCQSCTSGDHSNYSLYAFNERVKEIEALLEQNLKLRLQSESVLQQEIQSRENLIHALMVTLEKYEKKIESDKMVIKFREEAIKRLQKGGLALNSQTTDELKEEILSIKRINENHPIAAKLFVENDTLKEHIQRLKSELKEDLNSLNYRLKENLEFTEKLHASLKKSIKEREQLHALLTDYSKYRHGELICTPERENRKKITEELNIYKSKVEELENILAEKNNILRANEKINDDPMKMEVDWDKQSIDDCFSVSRTSFSSKIYDPQSENLQNSERSCKANSQQNNNEDINNLVNEIELKDGTIRVLEVKVKNMIGEIDSLRKENSQLKYLEEMTFNLENILEKTTDELDRTKEQLEKVLSQNDILDAENDFLASTNSDMKVLVEKLEQENSMLKKRSNQNQPNIQPELLLDYENLKSKCSWYQKELDHQNEEMRISVQSREQILKELKHLQDVEYNLEKSIEDWQSQFNISNKENQRLKSEIDSLSKEISKLAGHNNLKQKIQMHARLKDENNKLRSQIFNVSEELRMKSEKLESLQRKYETLANIRGISDLEDLEALQKKKIEELEEEIKLYQNSIGRIAEFVNTFPYNGNPEDTDIADIVISVIKGLMESLSIKEREASEKDRELQRKESLIKILENEHLLYKHKVELKEFNNRIPLEENVQKYH
ncbi:unnamed protein product [Blepharisma stoltei]|uniref:Kinesin motor domain-containing protein n=1 Tax=Blepharisma stoltei TaxID=1481888 RepID=A0AAU9I7R5_9CILI|nr:unnamed protein product [Blepharisma stoltei]